MCIRDRLKADADGPESILEPAVLKGKLIYKQDLYTQLVTSMSQSLDWTYQGLASISEPYFFSTVDYTTSKMIVLYAVLATGFAAACLGFLHAFLLLGFPQLTMAILRLRRYGKSSNTVSYTHLDVYKRQLNARLLPNGPMEW